MSSEILLYSGGIDSFIAWFFLGKPKVLFVDMGLKSNFLEKKTVIEVSKKFPEMDLVLANLDLSWIPMSETELPMRNLFLVMVASCFADNIWIVCQKGETNLADRDSEFMEMSSNILTKLWGAKKAVWSPFFDLTKVDMVKWYTQNVGDINDLDALTACCYQGEKFCGNCSACFRKWVSLRLNGGGACYDASIRKGSFLKKYIDRANSGDPTLGKERVQEILLLEKIIEREVFYE